MISTWFGVHMSEQIPNKGKIPVTVRVPEALLRQIDECLKSKQIPVSRNTWLLEAALEKLDRTRNGERQDGPQ